MVLSISSKQYSIIKSFALSNFDRANVKRVVCVRFSLGIPQKQMEQPLLLYQKLMGQFFCHLESLFIGSPS